MNQPTPPHANSLPATAPSSLPPGHTATSWLAPTIATADKASVQEQLDAAISEQ